MLWKMVEIAQIHLYIYIYAVENGVNSTDSSLYIKYIYAVENGRNSTDLCYLYHLYTTLMLSAYMVFDTISPISGSFLRASPANGLGSSHALLVIIHITYWVLYFIFLSTTITYIDS